MDLKFVKGIGKLRKGMEKQAHLSRAYKQVMRVYDSKGIQPSLTEDKRNFITVSIPTNGIDTQGKSTKSITESAMEETLELFPQEKFQTTIYSVLASLASRLASLEKGKDLRTPEGLSFLKSLGSSTTKDPNIFSLKTSRVCLVTKREKLSRRYLGFLPTWGIELNGRFLIASTSAFPRTGSGCSLSDILEKKVDSKYFLSEKMVKHIFEEKKGQNQKPNIAQQFLQEREIEKKTLLSK